jgi:hypothetical protein
LGNGGLLAAEPYASPSWTNTRNYLKKFSPFVRSALIDSEIPIHDFPSKPHNRNANSFLGLMGFCPEEGTLKIGSPQNRFSK